MRTFSYVGIGVLFSLGLVLSEMTNPERIIAFLDFSGDFDPSLLFVMLGAVLVHGATYRFVLRRPSPLWSDSFSIPPTQRIDARLVIGAALFGVGWGLAGYCPGPALTSALTFSGSTMIFIGSMVFGMFLFKFSHAAWERRAGTQADPRALDL